MMYLMAILISCPAFCTLVQCCRIDPGETLISCRGFPRRRYRVGACTGTGLFQPAHILRSSPLEIDRNRKRNVVSHEDRPQDMCLEAPDLIIVQHAIIDQVGDQDGGLRLHDWRAPRDIVEADDSKRLDGRMETRLYDQIVNEAAHRPHASHAR